MQRLIILFEVTVKWGNFDQVLFSEKVPTSNCILSEDNIFYRIDAKGIFLKY